MAKKYYTFKKYEENRKKTDRFLKKVHRKSVRDWKKASRQREAARNKRMRAYKREKDKRNAEKQKAYNNANTATTFTFGDTMLALVALILFGLFFVFWFEFGFWKSVWTTIILFLFFSQIVDDISNRAFDLFSYVIIALFAATVIFCFVVGFWWGLLIGVGLCAVVFVLYLLFSSNDEIDEETENNDIEPEEQVEDRSEQIPYLQSLLTEFDRHKRIINTSDDPDAVKRSLDCLLGIMDEIMTFDEMLLRKAGMTKSQMPEHKARVLELYDTMIEQAREEQKNKQS